MPLLATNDSHYTHSHEPTAHDALLCVQTGTNLDDPDRFRFDGDRLLPEDPGGDDATLLGAWPEALRQHPPGRRALDVTFNETRTTCRASRCPRATPRSPGSQRRSAGPPRRFPDGVPDDRRSRPSTRWTSSSRWGSPGTSSWSPTSSCGPRTTASRSARAEAPRPARWWAYAMGITDLDPLQHGLIFERFLNPERVSMPDVDIDFDERRRGEVIRYVTEKYGADKVARSAPTARSRRRRPSRTRPACSAIPTRMGEKSPRRSRPPVMGKDIPLSGHPRQGSPSLQGSG